MTNLIFQAKADKVGKVQSWSKDEVVDWLSPHEKSGGLLQEPRSLHAEGSLGKIVKPQNAPPRTGGTLFGGLWHQGMNGWMVACVADVWVDGQSKEGCINTGHLPHTSLFRSPHLHVAHHYQNKTSSVLISWWQRLFRC